MLDLRAFQGVIFDFGSTLAIGHVPWPSIMAQGASALTAFLQAEGLSLPDNFPDLWVQMLRFATQQAARDGVERPAERTLEQLLDSQQCDNLAPGLIRSALDVYFGVEDGLRAPANGGVETLAALKAAGYRVAVLSNTIGGSWVRHWVDKFGYRPHVDAVLTSDEIGYRKPRPQAFRAALAVLGLPEPGAAVMVGDSLGQDVAGAHALGMRAVYVRLAEDHSFDGLSWPTAEERERIIPDAAITELPALLKVLERWQSDVV